jgi:branched-chain amino acid transport system ATP-binding protein
MLRAENLSSGYGPVVALRNLSLALEAGSIVALLGPNGAGKSTAVMTLAGLVRPQAGRISIDGEEVTRESPRLRASRGLGLVPEGRRVFAGLTVEENLIVGAYRLPHPALLENRGRVLRLFPRLAERLKQRAGSLSGGEQQMLAIGRAIMGSPRLLLVDELSLGLMPRVVDECYAALALLREEGLAILLVDQNSERALAVADSVVVLDSGHPIWSGSGDAARRHPAVLDAAFSH